MTISPYVYVGIAPSALLRIDKKRVVAEIIATYFGLTFEQLVQKSRKPVYAFPRQLLSYLLYRLMSGIRHEDISELIGSDRTTVIHSIQRIQGFVDVKDEETLKHIKNLTQIIKTS